MLTLVSLNALPPENPYPYSNKDILSSSLQKNPISYFQDAVILIVPVYNSSGKEKWVWLSQTLTSILYRRLKNLDYLDENSKNISYHYPSAQAGIFDVESYQSQKQTGKVQNQGKDSKKLLKYTKDFFQDLYAPGRTSMSGKAIKLHTVLIPELQTLSFFKKENRQVLNRELLVSVRNDFLQSLPDKIKEKKFTVYVVSAFFQPEESHSAISQVQGTEKVNITLKLLKPTGEIWQRTIDLHIKGEWTEWTHFQEELVLALSKNDFHEISIHTEPMNARIYIDGQFAGVTPLHLNNIKPGRRYITAIAPDYKRESLLFNHTSGRSSIVRFKLKELGNKKNVSLIGTNGANIFVNGDFLCTLPCTKQSIPAGRTRIVARKKGFLDLQQKGDVKRTEHQEQLFSFFLQADPKKEVEPGFQSQYPYRGLSIFLSGNQYERYSKYWLAFSVLSFTAAILVEGIGLKRIDSYFSPEANADNPYRWYVNSLYIAGLSGLSLSGIYLYMSFDYDDSLFSAGSDNFHFGHNYLLPKKGDGFSVSQDASLLEARIHLGVQVNF